METAKPSRRQIAGTAIVTIAIIMAVACGLAAIASALILALTVLASFVGSSGPGLTLSDCVPLITCVMGLAISLLLMKLGTSIRRTETGDV